MHHMTHNYMLGLIVLVASFIVLFYVPIGYACFKLRAQQSKQK